MKLCEKLHAQSVTHDGLGAAGHPPVLRGAKARLDRWESDTLFLLVLCRESETLAQPASSAVGTTGTNF